GGSNGFSQQNWVDWGEGPPAARDDGSVAFEPIAKGVVDWGLLYAVTSFNDSKHDRRLQIGWAPEDMNSFGITQQGYQGALSIPRELFVKTTPNVVPPDAANSSSVYTRQPNGTFSARTLGARAAGDIMSGLRAGATHSTHNIPSLTGQGDGRNSHILHTSTNNSYALTFTIASTTGRTG